MVEAGFEPGVRITVLRWMSEKSHVNSQGLEDLEEMIFENILNLTDRHLWADMADAELGDWHIWYSYGYEP